MSALDDDAVVALYDSLRATACHHRPADPAWDEDDLRQEAILRLIEAGDRLTFERPHQRDAYARRTVINLAHDVRRRRRDVSSFDLVLLLAAGIHDTERDALSRVGLAEVLRALEGDPRVALLIRHVLGDGVRAMATAMGVEEATIKTRMWRARQALLTNPNRLM